MNFFFTFVLRLSSFTDSFKLVQRAFRNESITLLEINLVPDLLNHVTGNLVKIFSLTQKTNQILLATIKKINFASLRKQPHNHSDYSF